MTGADAVRSGPDTVIPGADAVRSGADVSRSGPDAVRSGPVAASGSGGELDTLCDDADLPSLLAALACATGDMSLAPETLWLDPARALEPDDGWDAGQVEQARILAISGLRRLSRPGDVGGLKPGRSRSADNARRAARKAAAPRLIDWLTGADLDDGYRTMLAEELAIAGDQRIPPPIDPQRRPLGGRNRDPAGAARSDSSAAGADRADHAVAVIGAGMSGILAAHRLRQAGVECTVLEKNGAVGGTWLENTYPGCRVDVFNHVYSYSGAQKADWPEYHSRQEVLLDYFQGCARRWGIGDCIRFGATVESLAWDGAARRWNIRLLTPSGVETITAVAVISAVGQLNLPLVPFIEGAGDFAGQSFHSSAWRHDIDWRGLRVAVIGTGASAVQFIPHLADEAARLTVFQRTPPWLIPRPEYHEPLPKGLLRLFETVPGYANWFRLRLFWRTHEGAVSALRRDPSWPGPLNRSVSERNDLMRELLTGYLESEFADRPDLLAKVTPDYPVGAKRVVLDNGIWARTLKRPRVELVSDAITRITPAGVATADNRIHAADVIVYGTGFRASEFLMPIRVTGRGGADLHDRWAGDARAYMGACVPGFPNLFMLYGPNTNIVVNGSIVYFAECAVHYAVECLRLLADTGAAAMDCRQEAYERYAATVDERNTEMAWGISQVNSWYKSPTGRVTQNWPFPLIDYWRQTRRPHPADYEFL